MYCPHCGVNNDRGEGECFICHKPLPSLTQTSTPGSKGAAARPKASALSAQEVFGGAGDRMLALLFDRVLILCVLVMVSTFVVDRWGAIDWRVGSVRFYIGAAVVLTIFLYHVLFEGAAGITIGKAIMGLQVRTVGDRGRFTGAALRNLLRVVDGIGMYFLGFLFVLFTPRRQRVGDLVGGTVVMDASIGRGARAAMLLLWIAVVGTALWISSALCPTWRPDLPFTVQQIAATR